MRPGSRSAGMMWEIPRKLKPRRPRSRPPPPPLPHETQTSARSYELFQ